MEPVSVPQTPCNLVININVLKSGTADIKSDICTKLGIDKFCDITVAEMKKQALNKQVVSNHLLKLIKLSDSISNSTNICNSDQTAPINFKDTESYTSLCSQIETTLNNYSETFKSNNEFVEKINLTLQSLESSIKNSVIQSENLTNSNTSQQQPVLCDTNTEKFAKSTSHYEKYDASFIEEDVSSNLHQYLDKLGPKFNKLKGRSVLTFGEPYPYVGAPKETPDPIPGIIQEIISKINEEYPDSDINSCLINKYTGSSSYLPVHSDDESVIEPESCIYTVSIGATNNIKFHNKLTRDTFDLSPKNGSLYVMSRQSQNFWSHEIVQNTELGETDVRYSLTFRSVGSVWKSSTVILGDSNTKYLKFSSDPTDKKSFGSKMPGCRIETFHIGDIEPLSCIGYQNIILHVGINDLRDRSPGRKSSDPAPWDVKNHFMRFQQKIEHIQLLCPKSSIIVSSVLPTMIDVLNNRAGRFNRYLCDYVFNLNSNIRIISHDEFVQDGALNPVYGCYQNIHDKLHLGKQGIKKLAKSFKDNALSYRRRTDIRDYCSVVSKDVKAQAPSNALT